MANRRKQQRNLPVSSLKANRILRAILCRSTLHSPTVCSVGLTPGKESSGLHCKVLRARLFLKLSWGGGEGGRTCCPKTLWGALLRRRTHKKHAGSCSPRARLPSPSLWRRYLHQEPPARLHLFLSRAVATRGGSA